MSTQISPVLFALHPTLDQADTLTKTLLHFNSASQYVVDFAVDHIVFGGSDLMRATDDVLRDDYRLTEHMAAQAVEKAVDVCRFIPMVSGIPIVGPPRIGEHSPMVVDLATIEHDMAVIRLATEHHVRLRYVAPGCPGRNAGPAELVVSDNEFFLFVDANEYNSIALQINEDQKLDETWRQRAMASMGLIDGISPLSGVGISRLS